MKQFIIKSFIIIFPTFILFWNFSNYERSGGDLNRIGKISIEKDYRKIFKKEFEQPIKYKKLSEISLEKENVADIVTIGDSFSLQGSYGYQNNLVEIGNIKVISIENQEGSNPIEALNAITNGNLFDKLKTKYVILESVERLCVKRGLKINKEKVFYREEFKNKEKINLKEEEKKITLEIFQEITKYFVYNLLYNFDEKAYISQVYKMDLNNELFSNRKKELLFYDEEINNLKYNTKEKIIKLNNELNLLSEKLDKKGIKLIFLPCADKYDIYYDYIENNKLPKNNFFEYMNEVSKNIYILIQKKCWQNI